MLERGRKITYLIFCTDIDLRIKIKNTGLSPTYILESSFRFLHGISNSLPMSDFSFNTDSLTYDHLTSDSYCVVNNDPQFPLSANLFIKLVSSPGDALLW